jgi:hypothetical protein
MDQPRIRRYALLPGARENGVRRLHLARVAPSSRSALGADRLERMEDVAALERPAGDSGASERPDS